MATIRRRSVFNVLAIFLGLSCVYVFVLLIQWITVISPKAITGDLPVLIKSIIPRGEGTLDITLTVSLEDIIRHLEGYKHANGEATANPVPMNTTYLKNIPNFCAQAPKYLVYVHTSPNNVKRRALIRETWGDAAMYPQNNFKIIFMMGLPEKKSEQKVVDDEFDKYNDIIQGSFVDNYKNLTLKAIMCLKWTSQYCEGAKYIIKADDDAFVNTFELMKIIEQNDERKKLMVCPLWKDNSMPILRNPEKCMKWCVKYSEFPGMNYFPKYCAGLTYAMSQDLVSMMYQKSLKTPFFWIDDVYVTGLLLGKIEEVNYVDIMKNITLKEKLAAEQYKNTDTKPTYLISHVKNPDNWNIMWKSALKRSRVQNIDHQ